MYHAFNGDMFFPVERELVSAAAGIRPSSFFRGSNNLVFFNLCMLFCNIMEDVELINGLLLAAKCMCSHLSA